MAARTSGWCKFNDQAGRAAYCLYVEGWIDGSYYSGSNIKGTAHTAAWLYCTYSSTPFYQHEWTKQLYVDGSMQYDSTDYAPTSSSDWSSCNVGIDGTTYNRVYFIGEATKSISHSINDFKYATCKVGVNFKTNGNYMPVKDSYWAECYPYHQGFFNLNILNPNGKEEYNAGTVELSYDGTNYSRVDNENISYPILDSYIYFRNFSPGTGMAYKNTTGQSSGDAYSGNVKVGADTLVTITTKWASYWNDINAYKPDGQTQNGLKFNLTTSDGGSWTNITNEPESFTKQYNTKATISNISSNVTGAHYDYNNVTWDGSTSFSWYFTSADWVCKLYTAWNTYTVKYNANGGSGSMSNTNATYNTAFNLRSNSFTRTGYNFGGWATSASGGAAYSNGQSVNNLTATDGGTVNLYAVWNIAKPYSLSFSRTSSTTSSITFSCSASGVGVNQYAIYYRKGTSGSFSGVISTTTSITVKDLEPDTNYQFYFGASNSAGQTTINSDSPVTYSTLLGNPTITIPEVSNLLPFSCTISATGSISPSRTLTYRFSKDNGSTWTAYQTSNSYNWTGLAEETSYNMAVQVKATHAGTNASDTTGISYLTITTPADQAKIRKKENGSWIKGKGWVKIEGNWTKMKKIYKKVNGQWVIGKND